MSQIILVEQASNVSSPAASQVAAFANNETFPKLLWKDDAGHVSKLGDSIRAASIVATSGAYASDTYLAGSGIPIPAVGDWRQGATYVVAFDIAKSAAGAAAFTVNVRMGTLGNISDASVLSLAFAAGTGVADTGWMELFLNFRSVGSGTSAVVAAILKCSHHLAATGLITTGASGFGLVTGTSAGFNSTTQDKIGVSINGGSLFSGVNTIVQAQFNNA